MTPDMLLFPARSAPRLKGGNDPGRARLELSTLGVHGQLLGAAALALA